MTLSERLTQRVNESMQRAHGACKINDRVRMTRYAIESQGWDEIRQMTESVTVYFRQDKSGRKIFLSEDQLT